MARVYKRGNTWSFEYYDVAPDGAKTRVRLGGYSSYQEADLARQQAESDVVLRKNLRREQYTLEDYIIVWFNSKKKEISYNTFMSYKNAIYRYIIPLAGRHNIRKLKPMHVKKLYDDVCNMHSSVCEIVKSVLKKALEYGVEERYCYSNAAADIQIPVPRVPKKMVPYSKAEIERLLLAAKQTNIFIDILLSVVLGLRKCEVRALRYSDINFKTRVCTIQRALGRTQEADDVPWGQKTKQIKKLKTKNAYRTIVLPQFVLFFILEQRKLYEQNLHTYGEAFFNGDYICCNEKGQPRSSSYYYKPFKALLELAGLPYITWHTLRHCAASFISSKTQNLKALSRILGHGNMKITADVYIECGKDIQDAMKLMNGFIGGILGEAEQKRSAKSIPAQNEQPIAETKQYSQYQHIFIGVQSYIQEACQNIFCAT